MSAPMTHERAAILAGRITEARSCHGKVAYHHRNFAVEAVKRWEKEGKRFHIYKCGWGDHWHLASERRDDR